MGPGTNYLNLLFIVKGVITFLPGLLANYADKYLPSFLTQFIRYGRANVAKKGEEYGVLKRIEVPKKWFYHVYIYAIFLQSFIIYTVFTTYQNKLQNPWLKSVLNLLGGNAREETVNASTTVLVEILFLIQLLRRLYETCFVCVYSNTKMNVMHYLMTYTHYTGCMLVISAYSSVFSGSSLKGTSLTWTDINVQQIIAVVIFFYGSSVQYQAHVGLASLRKGKENKVVTLKHQIPRGGLFETISCPNYWGEILVYSAIAGVFSLRNTTWNYITLWVTANQITTGVMNHRWYQATFKDYPTNRKAVIPYFW